MLDRSYLAGDASDYQGSDLINEANGGVVVVTVQYRLGGFGKACSTIKYPHSHKMTLSSGFLAGEKVKADGALNAGLCQ